MTRVKLKKCPPVVDRGLNREADSRVGSAFFRWISRSFFFDKIGKTVAVGSPAC